MSENPDDLLMEGIASLGAIYGLLCQAAGPRSRDMHLVDPDDLSILVRVVQERFIRAQHLLHQQRRAA